MCSKGSRFTLGVWGLRVCSLDVVKPSATVRVRAVVSSATGVTFGGFKRRVASFRVAGVALRDIQTCFVSRRKCFVWQAQHFGRVHRHFAWQAQHTLDVSCVACFCESHYRSCAKWRQSANSVAGVAFYEM